MAGLEMEHNGVGDGSHGGLINHLTLDQSSDTVRFRTRRFMKNLELGSDLLCVCGAMLSIDGCVDGDEVVCVECHYWMRMEEGQLTVHGRLAILTKEFTPTESFLARLVTKVKKFCKNIFVCSCEPNDLDLIRYGTSPRRLTDMAPLS